MDILIKYIPEDIIREHILPYTYNIQSPILCSDIQNFIETKYFLINHYRSIYPSNKCVSLNWLINDITRFMNGGEGTMFFIKDNHIQIYKRLFMMKEKLKQEVIYYIHMSHKSPIKYDMNTRLGLLVPTEREELKTFVTRNSDTNPNPLNNSFPFG